MAVDSSGNIYVAGRDTGSIQASLRPYTVSSCLSYFAAHGNIVAGPCTDAFVMKLDPTGTKILYATYIGGSGNDYATNIAVDSTGNAYIAGKTFSADFPVTPGALQPKFAGPAEQDLLDESTSGDAFIAKLNPDGSLNYATYLGGTGADVPTGMQIDASGDVYVVGSTSSTDLPVTFGAYRYAPGAGFVAKINQTGAALVYLTYSDDAAAAIAVNAAGSVYLTGKPGFVSELNPAGTALVFSANLGSSGNNAFSDPTAIAVDPSGNVWVAGDTSPLDSTNGSPQYEAFVIKLNSSGSAVIRPLLFGEGEVVGSLALQMDRAGNAYVEGGIGPGRFPVTPNALLPAPCSDHGGQVLLKLDAKGNILYASYARQVIGLWAVLPSGVLDVLSYFGSRSSAINSALLTEPLVASQIDVTAAPQMNFGCPANSASWSTSSVAPGEIVSIFGSRLGPETGVSAQVNSDGSISSSLAGVQVLFNGAPAPLLYVQSKQVNAIVPFEIDPVKDFQVMVEIQYNGQSAPPLYVPAARWAPGTFTISGQPGTQGAILNQDGTVNSPANPAKLGSVISLFATGTGALTPAAIDGQISPIPPPWIMLATPPVVTVAGGFVDFLYAGAAPALVAGVTQINVQLPATLPVGISLNAVPVIVFMGNSSTAGSPPRPTLFGAVAAAQVLVSVAP